MKTIQAFIANKPWIYIVLAFVLLLAAWSTLITVAIKHSPQVVQVSK